MNKKSYIKPEVSKLVIDYTISLQMQSQPTDPPPRSGGKGGQQSDDPFKSPFGDKPFG